MTVSPFDSPLLSGLLQDGETAGLFSDAAALAAMLEVEAALALAQGDCGLIPPEAAKAISAAARGLTLDPAALSAATAQDGVPVPALVAALRKAVPAEHAPFVHWGATSQDIADTGLVLRLSQLADIFETRLRDLASLLLRMAETHRATPMAAHTRMQQATPTSFGLKAAVWLAPLLSHLERLTQLRPRLLRLSLGGASGNLAALAPHGLAVEAKLAERLGLTVSPVPWHVSRDGLMEFAGWCTLVTGSLGKIGQDIALLSQNEISELRPGSGGGSSTMPNKANPVSAEVLIALARHTGGQLGTLQQAAIAEYERSGAAWLIEWLSLPQIAAATGKALTTATSLLDSLVIDTARMRANIEASNGLLLAEAASFALAATMPRPQAQDLVKKACATVLATGTHLFDVLAAMTPVPDDWSALKDPALHMGESAALIDRIVESAQALGLES